ncbi:MAG: hypothetical protein EA428_04155 [Spirochaetaceae bacterium]|nr:MAG: hypothetical protein EA428_04155 [Spirochaetaceae bacterium]
MKDQESEGKETTAESQGMAAGSSEPRAEELILSIYSQIKARSEAGEPFGHVVMSVSTYRLIQAYRARLGEMPEGQEDYLGRYELFGLPVLIDTIEGCRVVE